MTQGNHTFTCGRFWLIQINVPAGAHAQMSRETVLRSCEDHPL